MTNSSRTRARALVGSAVIALITAVPSLAWAAQNDDPPPVRVGGAIKPPVRTKTVKPIYPPAARAARVQGAVIVEATIGTDGKVRATKVIRSLMMLDEAALTAIKGWEYKPTMVNGRVVPVIMTIPVNFVAD